MAINIDDIDFSEPKQPQQKSQTLDVSGLDLSDIDLGDVTPSKSTQEAKPEEEDSWGQVVWKSLAAMPERMQRSWAGLQQAIAPAFNNTDVDAQAESLIAAAQSGVESANQKLVELGFNPNDMGFINKGKLRQALAFDNVKDDEDFKAARDEGLRLSAEIAKTAPKTGDKWSPKNLVSTILTGAQDMAPSVILGLITKSPTAGLAEMTGQAYGSYMQDSLDKGLTPAQANNRAALFAVLEPVTEALPMSFLLKPGGKGLTDLGKTAVAEGLQESFTQAAQDAYDIGVLDEDMTVGQFLNNMAFSGVTGAGVGATLHGTIHGPGMVKQALDNRAVSNVAGAAAAESGQEVGDIDPAEYDAVRAEMGGVDALDQITEQALPEISAARRQAYADARASGMSPADALNQARGQDTGGDLLEKMVQDIFDSPDSVYYANKRSVVTPPQSVAEMVSQQAAKGDLGPVAGEMLGLPSPSSTSTIAMPGPVHNMPEFTEPSRPKFSPTSLADERSASVGIRQPLIIDDIVNQLDMSSLADADLPSLPTKSAASELPSIPKPKTVEDLPPLPKQAKAEDLPPLPKQTKAEDLPPLPKQAETKPLFPRRKPKVIAPEVDAEAVAAEDARMAEIKSKGQEGVSRLEELGKLPVLPGKKPTPMQVTHRLVNEAKARGVEPGAKVNWNGKEYNVDKLQGRAVRLLDENGNGNIVDIQEVNAPQQQQQPQPAAPKQALDVSDLSDGVHSFTEPATIKETMDFRDPAYSARSQQMARKNWLKDKKPEATFEGAELRRVDTSTPTELRGDAKNKFLVTKGETTTAYPTRVAAARALKEPVADSSITKKPSGAASIKPVPKGMTAFDKDSGTKGIPRAEMPQIKAKDRGAFVNYLKGKGVATKEEMVSASSLKPTQAEYDQKKVDGIAAEGMSAHRAILVSKDGHVIDGHHQWLAAKKKGQVVRVIRVDENIDQALEDAHAFPSSTTEKTSPSTEKTSSIKDAKPASKGMAPEQVAEIARDFIKQFRGVNAVDMSVMGRQADLGIDIPDGGALLGFYEPGKISAKLIAENLSNREEVEALLRHELIVHFGMRSRLSKPEYDAEMDKVLAAEKSLALRKYFTEARARYDEFYDTSSVDGQRMIAEEVVARVAEDPKALERSSVVRRVIEAIRQLLIKAKLLPNNASMESVRQLIQANSEYLRNTIVDRNDVRVSLPPMAYNAPKDMTAAMNKPTDIDKAEVPDSIKDGMRRTMYRDTRSMTQRIRDMMADRFSLSGIYQGAFDDLHAIARYEKMSNNGKLKMGRESAYKLSMLSKNINSVVAVAMNKGAPVYDNGAIGVDKNTKGFTEIFKPVMSLKGNMLPVWEYWAAAVRAKKLLAEGREQLFSQKEVDDIIDYVNRRPDLRKAFNEAHKDWRALNKAVLNFGEATGIIDPEARKLFESDDYVPFYRVDEEADRVSGPSGKRGLANQSSGIRRLKGGEGKVDILENMARNVNHIISSGFKNAAMQRVKDIALGAAMETVPTNFKPVGISNSAIKSALNDMGVATSGMSAKELAGYTNLFTAVAPAGPNIITIRYDGKPQYFEVTDPQLMRALAGLGPERLHDILKVLAVPKKILTRMVTSTPTFIATNMTRDIAGNFVQMAKESGRNTTPKIIRDILTLRPVYKAMQGAYKSFTDHGMVTDYQVSGGMSGGYDQSRPESVAKHLRKLGKRNVIVDTPTKLWDLYQDALTASEQATRMAVYEDVLKHTGDPVEAAYQSNDVMNFSRRGDNVLTHVLISTIPFLNARLQGLDRLARGAKDSPKSFLLKGAIITAATMSLMALNADDEDYWALPEYERDMFWVIPVNGTRYRIPKPFEIGAVFGTIPERIFEATFRQDHVLWDRIKFMLTQTFAVDPTQAQFFKPVYEDQTNMNGFTQRPIVPQALQRVGPTEQYSTVTPDWIKAFSKSLPESAPDWMRSPLRLQHLIEGYTGSVGKYVVATADSMYRSTFTDRVMPAKRDLDYPIVKAFVRTGVSGDKYVDRLYQMSEKAGAFYGTLKAYKDQNMREEYRKFKEDNRSVLAARRNIDKSVARMQKLNKQTKAIYANDGMTPEAKREALDKLTVKKNELAKEVSDKYWMLF